MISKTVSTTAHAAYQNRMQESKGTKQNTQATPQNEKNEISKVEQIKESINSNKYKVNIEATAQKMAESLL